MDTVSLCTWKYGIYKDIAEDAETDINTSNYDLGRSLPKWKTKKVIEFIEDE